MEVLSNEGGCKQAYISGARQVIKYSSPWI